MMWPYIVLGLLISIVKIYLSVLDSSVIFIKILDIIDIFCYMILEYKLINKYVKIKFFENKKRLKVLIICQFVLIEILTMISNYMIEKGIYIG